MARCPWPPCIRHTCGTELNRFRGHVAGQNFDGGLVESTKARFTAPEMARRLRLPGRLRFNSGPDKCLGRSVLFRVAFTEAGIGIAAADYLAGRQWSTGG